MAATQNSAKLGSTLPGTTHPDVGNSNSAVAQLVAAVNAIENSMFGLTEYTAAGAITPARGTVALKAGSAAAMTLVAPTAAQEGMVIEIVAEDAYAYTVTTPASKINGPGGLQHILTWTAAIGNSCRLVARNQVWQTTALNGVALS